MRAYVCLLHAHKVTRLHIYATTALRSIKGGGGVGLKWNRKDMWREERVKEARKKKEEKKTDILPTVVVVVDCNVCVTVPKKSKGTRRGGLDRQVPEMLLGGIQLVASRVFKRLMASSQHPALPSQPPQQRRCVYLTGAQQFQRSSLLFSRRCTTRAHLSHHNMFDGGMLSFPLFSCFTDFWVIAAITQTLESGGE